MPIGVYLHVPFCDGKCPYCDFYSTKGNAAAYDRFVAATLRAIQCAPALPADTIYFGGGTPVLLGADRLCRLLLALREKFGENQTETTLEANPGAVSPEMLSALVAGGFDRISFGVQSLREETLRVLGRRHSAAAAKQAILWAKQTGFSHLSADLMLAVPGQTLAEIADNLRQLAALPIDHLSAYLLKIEENTAFFRRYPDPEEDFAADAYLCMVKTAEELGFSQYEISNFAKSPAAEGKHNLKYWHCEEYLGIGPAAHSFYEGKRFYFPRTLEDYCEAENPWELTVPDGEGGSDEEKIMLGLRLREGISLDAFPAATAQRLSARAVSFQQHGLATVENRRLRLTPEGFLLSNSILATLLAE